MKNKIYALALSLGMFSPLSCAMECSDGEEDIDFNVDHSIFFNVPSPTGCDNKGRTDIQSQSDNSSLSPFLRSLLDNINNQKKSDKSSEFFNDSDSKVPVVDLTSSLNNINSESNNNKIINNLYNKKLPDSKMVSNCVYEKFIRAMDLLSCPTTLQKYKEVKDKDNVIVETFIDVLDKHYHNVPLSIFLSRCETNLAEGIDNQDVRNMLKTFSTIYFCRKISQLSCFNELIMKNILIDFIEGNIISKIIPNYKAYSYDKLINILSWLYYKDQGKNKEKYELAWFGWAITPSKKKSQQLNKKKYLNNHCFIDTTCLENNDFKNQLRLKHRDLKEKWEKAGTLDLTLSPETLQKLHDLLNS